MKTDEQICRSCMKVRLNNGSWLLIDIQTEACRADSLCPECSRREFASSSAYNRATDTLRRSHVWANVCTYW